MKDRLMNLISNDIGWVDEQPASEFVDYLLAEGVTVPVRCQNCVWAEKCGDKYECMHDHGLVELLDGNDFCSYGEEKE